MHIPILLRAMSSAGAVEISDDERAITMDGVLVTEGATVLVPNYHKASPVAVGASSSISGATAHRPVNAIMTPRYVTNTYCETFMTIQHQLINLTVSYDLFSTNTN